MPDVKPQEIEAFAEVTNVGFLADMPPVAFLTTFCVKKTLTMAADTVHGSHHPCTMRGHLCEETGARCGAQVSSRGRVEKATRGHATKLAQP